jgi:hypothetical protein
MRICRVVAVYREGGHAHENYKCVFICGITDSLQMESGEWFGYCQNEKELSPFVLKDGTSCFYGGEEHYSEPTNIGTKSITPGSMFTISSPPGSEETWNATYEIVSCHSY